MKKDTRIREINPFGLRMQAELKERLDIEAKISGRSLNAEIVYRLQLSLENQAIVESSYTVKQPAVEVYENAPEISNIEMKLLSIFRRMPVEKQLALLSLFN